MYRVGYLLLVLAVVGTGQVVVAFPPSSSGRIITVNELIPLASSRKEFKITDGKDRGKTVPLIFQANPGDEKRWTLTFGEYGRISLLSAPGGALLMERMDLSNGKSYIVYEPALPVLLPGDANSAGAVQRETGYRMYRAESGALKRSGRVTHLVKRISLSRFHTPAGPLEGYYIEIQHTMDMEFFSQLVLTVGLGCRLEEGLVYGSAHYKLRKLGGIFTETKTAAAGLAQRQ